MDKLENNSSRSSCSMNALKSTLGAATKTRSAPHFSGSTFLGHGEASKNSDDFVTLALLISVPVAP